jgi:hypothetical protein
LMHLPISQTSMILTHLNKKLKNKNQSKKFKKKNKMTI